MAAPYLIEVRTGGEVKEYLREIIYDVADRFDVRGAAQPRAVPHITLYGPYNTDQGRRVKNRLTSICSTYEIVPYRIDGFDAFRDNNVIYARVVPSKELRSLRRKIARELRELTYNTPPWDSDYYHTFHVTIAFRDVASKFDDIWEYVTERYEPSFDEYAIRISALRNRRMLWEYDLLQDTVLDSDTATSASSWERSMELLAELEEDDDHENLRPKPWMGKAVWNRLKAKAIGQW